MYLPSSYVLLLLLLLHRVNAVVILAYAHTHAHTRTLNIVALPQECSNLLGDCYIFPAKEELMKYKIVVTTLITAGR